MRSWILIPAENDKAIAAAAGSGAGAIVIDLARPLAPGLQAAARMAASAWLRAHREQVVAERRFERWARIPGLDTADWREALGAAMEGSRMASCSPIAAAPRTSASWLRCSTKWKTGWGWPPTLRG